MHGLNSLKRRALWLDEGDHIIDKMNGLTITETMELLCCAGPIEKDMLFLGHWLPNSLPPPPWHVPWEMCKPLLLQVLAACNCDAALFWGSRV